MLKKLAIPFIVGSVIVAYSQIPRNGGNQHSKPNATSHSAQCPTPTVAVTCTCSGGENNAKQEQPRPADKSNGYQWTEFLAPANVPTGLLVLVGFAGICVGIWTLSTIKRQVDTFVSKERARITVDIKPIELGSSEERQLRKLYDKTPMPPLGTNQVWYADLLISNSGETNAFIGHSLCKAYFRAMGWNPQEEIFNSSIGLPKVMHPHMHPHVDAFEHRLRIETGHVLRPEVDEGMAQAIADGLMGVYVIGHIEFGDVFGNLWTVKFCRRWGAWYFGGEWQECDVWYDYPDDILPEESSVNGEFRIKRPSFFQKLWLRMRKSKDPDFPILERGKERDGEEDEN